MSIATSTLPELNLNPGICARDLLDLEVDFRSTFNYMLDADETDRNVRDAGRQIIRRLLDGLNDVKSNPKQVLLEFVHSTNELFESATGRLGQIRTASAKCLMGLWVERTQIYSPLFQTIFYAIKQLGTNFPRPDLFEWACFRALASCPALPRVPLLLPGLYGLATRDGDKRRSA